MSANEMSHGYARPLVSNIGSRTVLDEIIKAQDTGRSR